MTEKSWAEEKLESYKEQRQVAVNRGDLQQTTWFDTQISLLESEAIRDRITRRMIFHEEGLTPESRDIFNELNYVLTGVLAD